MEAKGNMDLEYLSLYEVLIELKDQEPKSETLELVKEEEGDEEEGLGQDEDEEQKALDE